MLSKAAVVYAIMYRSLILYFCIIHVISKRHVMRFTPKLRDKGYHTDVDLGYFIAETMADSSVDCQRLCEETSACHSVMFIGKLCMMYAASHCSVSLDMQSSDNAAS